MTINFLQRAISHLLVAFAVAALGGCVLRPYTRSSQDPALAAIPPCYAGDVCNDTYGAGFAWAAEAISSVRR